MEIWKNIPGWEKYYASDLGRIRSTRKILSPGKHNKGYMLVALSRFPKRWSVTVHQLVMLAFKGPPPPGHEVCHNNGKPFDNRLINLRYDTRQNNALDRRNHGTSQGPRGEKSGAAKLSERDVKWIRANNDKMSMRQMGLRYKVSGKCIAHVLKRETWAHL